MEQKIAPTSPRYQIQQEPSNGPEMTSPHGAKKAAGIWYGVIFFFVSLLGGAVAFVVLLTYGQHIGLPELSQLLDQSTLSSVRTGTRDYSEREAAQQAFVESSLTRLITVYSLPEGTSLDTTKFLTSSQVQGFGVILTSNGIGMTTMTVIPDETSRYVGQRADGKTELLKNIKIDRHSGLTFFSFPGSGLPVVDLSDTIAIPLEDVKAISRSATDETFFLYRDSLRKLYNTGRLDESEFIEPSEVFFNTYAFVSSTQLLQGTPIFSDDGSLIGFFTGSDGNSSVLYLPERRRVITQYLENRKIIYPYLGVQGVALHTVPQTTNVLQLPKNGFLIRATPDKSAAGVIKNSPAALAGLRSGDVILSLTSGTIDSNHSLGQLLLATGANQTTDVRVLRDGSEQVFSVSLQELK